MGSDRAALAIAAHLIALGGAIAASVWAWQRADSGVLLVLAIAATAVLFGSLATFLGRQRRDLVRFVEAVGHGDLSQRFGNGELADALDAAMRRLREERHLAGEDARFAAALIEETPVALATIDADHTVRLLNRAARALLGDRDGRPLDAFARFGAPFVDALGGMEGGRTVVPFVGTTGEQRAMTTTAAFARSGRSLRLVAIEPIGRELDAAEVAAQADLVRVLTHEIMNSMTPITSLARSAATLMARVPDTAGEDVADARRAVDIVADRAEGLLGFVGSYRQYATMPMVHRRSFAALPWAQAIVDLFDGASYARNVALELAIDPQDCVLVGDPDLLVQAVVNLLKNAAEAGARRVRLWIVADQNGASIGVDDDGPGVADAVAPDMFLPFFTSKPGGTGIGLSIARQVAVAHGGSISVGRAPLGGARLEIKLWQGVEGAGGHPLGRQALSVAV